MLPLITGAQPGKAAAVLTRIHRNKWLELHHMFQVFSYALGSMNRKHVVGTVSR